MDNVVSVNVSPHAPVIFTASEDGTIISWDSNTYVQTQVLNYHLGKAWFISSIPKSNVVALGFDSGTVLLKLGSEKPVVDMNRNGYVIIAQNTSIKKFHIKSQKNQTLNDGDSLNISTAQASSVDLPLDKILFSPNGSYVATVNVARKEYSIRQPRSWTNMKFGTSLDFCWKAGSSHYALLDPSNTISVFNPKAKVQNKLFSFTPSFPIKALFGGPLIAAVGETAVVLYDWEQGRLITSLGGTADLIYWNSDPNFTLVTIIAKDKFFILRYHSDVVQQAMSMNKSTESGIPGSLSIIHRGAEAISSGTWVGCSFAYTSSNRSDRKLKVLTVGPPNQNKAHQDSNPLANMATNEDGLASNCTILTIALLDRPMFVLRFFEKYQGPRIFLFDQEQQIVSFSLDTTLIDFTTKVLFGQVKEALSLTPQLAEKSSTRCTNLLISQGYPHEALQVAQDVEQKFNIALALDKLDACKSTLDQHTGSQERFSALWTTLGKRRMDKKQLKAALDCFEKARDFGSLLLIYSSIGNKEGLERIAAQAAQAKVWNTAFLALSTLGYPMACLDILLESYRYPEAAAFSRTYLPSQVDRVVQLWKKALIDSDRASEAEAILSPSESPDSFPNWEEILSKEAHLRENNAIDTSTLKQLISRFSTSMQG